MGRELDRPDRRFRSLPTRRAGSEWAFPASALAETAEGEIEAVAGRRRRWMSPAPDGIEAASAGRSA